VVDVDGPGRWPGEYSRGEFPAVAVFNWTGDHPTNLVRIASQTFAWFLPSGGSSNVSREILRFQVQAGQPYQFQLSSPWETKTFTFTLDLSTLEIVAPAAGGLLHGPTNLPVQVSAPTPEIEGSVIGMMVGRDPTTVYADPDSWAVPLSEMAPFTGTLTNLEPGFHILTAWGTNAAGRFIATPNVPVRVAPWNDDFSSARIISGWITNELFWVNGASIEEGEPALDDQSHTFSVWWRWTAVSDSAVRIWLYEPAITVFEGDALNSLRRVGTSLPRVVRLDALAGHTYYIRATAGYPSSFLNIAPLVSNDDFANSIQISGSDVALLVTNTPTSIESGEPSHIDPDSNQTYGSLWWHWMAPTNGLLLVQSEAHVEIFSGDSLHDLVRQTSLDDPALPFGVAYRVRANERLNFGCDHSFASTNGTFRLRFIADPAPDRLQLNQLSREGDQTHFFASRASVGEEITIEASLDLQNWFVIGSEIAATPVVYIAYNFGMEGGDYRFFRAVRRPVGAH
jgi:hypothetical protein